MPEKLYNAILVSLEESLPNGSNKKNNSNKIKHLEQGVQCSATLESFINLEPIEL